MLLDTAKNNALKGRCSWKASGKGATPSKCKGVSLDNTIIPVYSGYIDGIPNLFTGQKPVIPEDKVVYNSNNLNQYTSVAYGTASINLKYDRNGNMIENEKFYFQYDYKNRLIKATAKPVADYYLVDVFTYDTLGRRLTKWMDTKSNVGRYIKYIYSNENAIEEERYYNIGQGREQTKEYVYGQGTDDVVKVYIEKQGLRNEQWFYKDQQGSVVAIADEYGKIVESYRYDAFGNLILGYQSNSIKFNLSPSDKNAQTNTANGSKSWITNTRLYTAREYDQELDLYYYRGRSYDARMGRFIQRDPIGYADDVNLYTYVGNNPMNYTDPWGLKGRGINANNVDKYNNTKPGSTLFVLSKEENDRRWAEVESNQKKAARNGTIKNIYGFFRHPLRFTVKKLAKLIIIEPVKNMYSTCSGNPNSQEPNACAYAVTEVATIVEGAGLAKGAVKGAVKSTAKIGSKKAVTRTMNANIGKSAVVRVEASAAGKIDDILAKKNVQDTLERIKQGKNKFPGHDGTPYTNRGNKLPTKPEGYYKEYTVETPGIQGRKGSERIVVGEGGEMYYTNTHYGDKPGVPFYKIK